MVREGSLGEVRQLPDGVPRKDLLSSREWERWEQSVQSGRGAGLVGEIQCDRFFLFLKYKPMDRAERGGSPRGERAMQGRRGGLKVIFVSFFMAR